MSQWQGSPKQHKHYTIETRKRIKLGCCPLWRIDMNCYAVTRDRLVLNNKTDAINNKHYAYSGFSVTPTRFARLLANKVALVLKSKTGENGEKFLRKFGRKKTWESQTKLSALCTPTKENRQIFRRLHKRSCGKLQQRNLRSVNSTCEDYLNRVTRA